MTFTAVDVFAGCGGLTTGLKKAGFCVKAAVELEASASSVFSLNHPEVLMFEKDVSQLDVTELFEMLKMKKGQLDLLAGCPPCQGFSSVRTLNGKKKITDDRNDLIFEFLRLAKGLFPKAIMLENVPGLAKDRRMETFARSLRGLGYSVRFKVLNVADYAVPQRRMRVVLLAGRFGEIEFARPSSILKTVRNAIGLLPPAGGSGDPSHDFPEQRSARIQQLISQIPQDGGSRMHLPRASQLKCHRRCDGFKDVYGRMKWDAVAPTLTTGCFNPSKGRFLHPEENRTITIREAALLQTFPRRYKFPAKFGKVALALQIGNALPPEFVRRHAEEIRKYLIANC